MAVQQTVEVLYLAIVGTLIVFVILFYLRARRAPKKPAEEEAPPAEGAPPAKMEKKERGWLYFLLAIVRATGLRPLLGVLLPQMKVPPAAPRET